METSQLTIFYIARHGQTEFNVKEIIQGHVDSPLTELGKEQAKELGDKLKNIHFDAAFSSDLFRAQHTAEIVKLDRQLAVTTNKLLRERSFGEYEGRSNEHYFRELQQQLEIFKQLPESEKLDFRHSPKMETYGESVERLIRFLRETSIAYPGKSILVLSHGAIIRAFLIKLGYATFNDLPSGSIGNGGYVKVESDGVDFFVRETYKVEKLK